MKMVAAWFFVHKKDDAAGLELAVAYKCTCDGVLAQFIVSKDPKHKVDNQDLSVCLGYSHTVHNPANLTLFRDYI